PATVSSPSQEEVCKRWREEGRGGRGGAAQDGGPPDLGRHPLPRPRGHCPRRSLLPPPVSSGPRNCEQDSSVVYIRHVDRQPCHSLQSRPAARHFVCVPALLEGRWGGLPSLPKDSPP